MKRILLIVSLCAGLCSRAQSFSIGFDRNNIAYIGVDNPLTCIVQNVPCKSIVLTTKNGTIEKGPCGYYNYRPSTIADTKIIINKKENGKFKKIGEYNIRARPIQDPVATIGGILGKTITKGQLLAQQGMGCITTGPPYFDINYQITGFCVSVIRNDQVIFYKRNKGYMFNEEVREFFKSLQTNDILLFSSITYMKPDKKEYDAQPFQLSIVEKNASVIE